MQVNCFDVERRAEFEARLNKAVKKEKPTQVMWRNSLKIVSSSE